MPPTSVGGTLAVVYNSQWSSVLARLGVHQTLVVVRPTVVRTDSTVVVRTHTREVYLYCCREIICSDYL